MLSRILEQVEHFRGGDNDILGSGYAEDSTDVYSSQFETILDNTSLYYSAESLETLYSEPDSYFSFEMPLTPMIQQRIKEGGQFLERTSAGGQQDVLSISADGGIVMGCSSGIANGLSGSSNSIYSKGTPEIAFWGRYWSRSLNFMLAVFVAFFFSPLGNLSVEPLWKALGWFPWIQMNDVSEKQFEFSVQVEYRLVVCQIGNLWTFCLAVCLVFPQVNWELSRFCGW